MRTKALITALLLGTTIAGVASADPIVRDHREPVTSHYQSRARFTRAARLQPRPSWMQYSNTTYGYQVDADGDEVTPYNQGQDPYVEGIARGEWSVLQPCVELEGRHAVRVDLSGRSLRSVELQATRGGANIIQVGILYRDGRQGSIPLDRLLDATHAPNLRLDLGAEALRGVNAIVVEGNGDASFRVIGG